MVGVLRFAVLWFGMLLYYGVRAVTKPHSLIKATGIASVDDPKAAKVKTAGKWLLAMFFMGLASMAVRFIISGKVF